MPTSTISEQLKAARARCKLTQSELSNASGVPQFRVSEYERGARLPSLKTLLALSKVLGPITVHDQ